MKRKLTLPTFAQSLYLSCKFFINNNLFTYASACALGFLFSFIPILMLVIIVLVRLLHSSPDVIFNYINLQSIFVDPEKIQNLTESILTTNKTGTFAIILLVSIFWMSQRFFFSVTTGMKTIFHSNTIVRRPILENVLTMVYEIVLVILIAIILLLFISASSVLTSDSFINKLMITYLPDEFGLFLANLSSHIFSLLPFLFIFLLSVVVFRQASGSKPKLKLCIIASLICSSVFWAVTKLLGLFLNIARYNLIYGVLSNLIIILLEVYIFFVLFFFTAQYIYTIQFFESLLLSELYLLPSKDEVSMYALIKRSLFIRPDKLISDEEMHIFIKKDEILYNENDISDGIYYVAKGSIKLFRENFITYADRGSFLGDMDCILEQNRSMNAKASTDSTLIFITQDEFKKLAESNPEVTKKMVDTLPSYIYRIYGRK